MARLIRRIAAHVVPLMLLVAVAPGTARGASQPLTSVSIAMGYIPNVQFAPFYVADARGYYKAANLKVSFGYATSTDVIKEVGIGHSTFGNAEGDQVIAGRAHSLPVISVLTQYQRFPVVVFALQSSGIRTFADLKGKTIGISGLYGASYIGLLAALAHAHLSTSDVHIEAIGYTQVQEVALHRVDAAVGYAMNEPVELSQQGKAVTVLPIADLVPLTGPGVVTNQKLVDTNPDLVRRFVAATYHGLQDTLADPSAAFTISRRYIPGIAASQVPYQLAVLRESVRYWKQGNGLALGCADAASWTVTQTTLRTQHQISALLPLAQLFTNRFVPGCHAA